MDAETSPEGESLRAEEIGRAVRAHRKRSGLSMVRLSEIVGVSQSFLSQLENGRVYPSVLTLYKLAEALDVTVGALLSPSPMTATAVFYRAGTAPVIPHGHADASDLSRLVTSPAGGHILLGLHHQMRGAQIADDVYQHSGEDLIVILRGVLTVHVGEDAYLMHPGDSLHYDGNQPHWFEKSDSPEVELLLVTGSPHGTPEHFVTAE
ncbi:helix-turn-helix domain-containing protein [Mycolicibacterium palauense]|uniref:helix-turn-helix domain-containing protein n=1 Tax=Mycolicibacterium palauense TaxID=2034511 RepID=UPI00159B91DF|nr:XRE family transcriptional regulator [Mycolicibacterium palauense]